MSTYQGLRAGRDGWWGGIKKMNEIHHHHSLIVLIFILLTGLLAIPGGAVKPS